MADRQVDIRIDCQWGTTRELHRLLERLDDLLAALGAHSIGSIGGGSVAPVPPFVPPAGRPQPFAASPVVFESDRPQDAADVVLSYFLEKTPEQPDHAYVRVHRQPDRVVTADTLEQWLRLRAQARTDTCHLHLAALRVGLAAADPGGVTFLVENVFVKAR